MRRSKTDEEQLRARIEAINARLFSTESIEARIAHALLNHGRFHADINSDELEVILRNVVYVMFAQQKVAGMGVGLLHNVPVMNVSINEESADIEFVVHIHKPIIVFLEFKYTLINHPDNPTELTVEDGSLRIEEKTRRFDIKAKTALAALNVSRIAEKELSHAAGVIAKTLPDQLREQGITGTFSDIGLRFGEGALNVFLQGEFGPLPEE